MNPHNPQQILCSLLGIAPIHLAVPCQILKVSPYERNPAAIEQAARDCFARVQSAQHYIGTDAVQWMMQVIADARHSMCNAAAALPPQGHLQPVPPPLPTPPQWAPQPNAHPSPPAAQPTEPAVVIRVLRPRRRSGVDIENIVGAIGSLLMCGLLVFGVGMFVRQSWYDLNRPRKKTPSVSPMVERTPDRARVKQGGGKAAPGGTGAVANGPGQTTPGVQPTVPNDERKADARENLTKAIELAGNGSFEEGYRLAKRARQAMPDESEGLMLMIDYVKQYSGLADAARLALNGSSEVDLGPPWGKAQFVEQQADSITFFANGKHKRFTLQDFRGLAGVRFRVTRDYLDRAANPANDLIIGSYQFLMRVNESGMLNVPGSRDAARRRFRKAIESGDSDSVENGALMITVLDFVKKP